MKTMQRGFTLIELVVVIVILGILAATALPKFIDLRSDANTAAIAGVAGGMSSAMAINYAGCAAVNFSATANKCVKVDNCDDTAQVMQGGVLPTGYSVTAAALTPAGTTANCTVTQTSSSLSAVFAGIGT